MKHLNVIPKPVERWFHYEKPLPIEMPRDLIIHYLKDDKGNEVLCSLGWAVFEYDGVVIKT